MCKDLTEGPMNIGVKLSVVDVRHGSRTPESDSQQKCRSVQIPAQVGDPFGILDVRLASRNSLDVLRIGHQCLQCPLQTG
jgi:hypothetical protein